MWELDYKESWVPKSWCFWTVVLEKTLESPLDCKEIQPVHPKDQSWVFIGRTDAEAEAPVLWPPDVKSWLIWEDPDDGKDWGQSWMASPTQWTWVWVNSRSWWWTGRPGMLQSMGSQRVGHNWATELNPGSLIYFQGFVDSQLYIVLISSKLQNYSSSCSPDMSTCNSNSTYLHGSSPPSLHLLPTLLSNLTLVLKSSFPLMASLPNQLHEIEALDPSWTLSYFSQSPLTIIPNAHTHWITRFFQFHLLNVSVICFLFAVPWPWRKPSSSLVCIISMAICLPLLAQFHPLSR